MKWIKRSLVIGMLVALAACGSSGGGSKSGSKPSSTTAPKETTTTTVPLKAATQAWAYANVAKLGAVQTALEEMSTAAGNNDVPGMGTACQHLHDANAALQQALPTPDAQLTSAFQSAIDDFDQGAHFCVSGTQQLSQSDIDQAHTFLDQADAHLSEASTRLDQITGG